MAFSPSKTDAARTSAESGSATSGGSAEHDNALLAARSLARVRFRALYDEPGASAYVHAALAIDLTKAARIPKPTRMTVLNKVAWALHTAIEHSDGCDTELAGALSEMAELLEALCFDVRRMTYAPYMFWDIALIGIEERLQPGGPCERYFRPIVESLLRLRFSVNPR